MNFARKAVLAAAVILVVSWITGNFGRITGDEDGIIRFVLGSVFALLILFRWKPRDVEAKIPGWGILLIGCVGAVMSLTGIIFVVHQFEWLGLILVLYACLRWALPVRFGKDIVLALFMLYWVHPIPGKIFGSFQIAMQYMSVHISEWLLHCLNVRVWADGMVLYTGGATFGVPESCSGMRTAVTVLLCVLGAGILLRLKWYQIISFIFFGALQVLLLNVIRISGMVYFAPRMPPEWAATFLHDTLGIFLLIAIVLIQFEMSWYKYRYDRKQRIREGIKSSELEPPDLGSVLPKFWRFFSRKFVAIVSVLFLILIVVFFIVKSRPSHTNEMVRDIIPGLVERDPELAARAIEQVLKYDPDDKEMRIEQIRVLLKQKRYEDVVEKVDALGPNPDIVQVIWKSWALMALDRGEEAVKILNNLPENVRHMPGVAIVNAEYAAKRDIPEDVSRNIVLASKWTALSSRIRNLFPYLAAREQWKAIVECNSNVPFEKADNAIIAIQANLQERNLTGAEQMLRVALKRWPEDVRFLGYITKMALNRPGAGWEDKMATNFMANIDVLTPDILAEYLGNCFNMYRPDLAWIAYLRLQQLAPEDPALPLAITQFADRWFVFPRKDIGVAEENGSSFINLQYFCQLTRNIKPFVSLWNNVPQVNKLAAPVNIEKIKKDNLEECLSGLENLEKTGKLSYRLQIMYPFALALNGNYAKAHKMLDNLMEQYPEKKRDILMRQATLYSQEGKWNDVYETLRKYRIAAGEFSLAAALQNVNAMMHLDMGVSAMQLINDAEKNFPDNQSLTLSKVALWLMFGARGDALLVLDKAGLLDKSPLAPQLLYDTGRFKSAEKASKVWHIKLKKNNKYDNNAILQFIPAEAVFTNKWPVAISVEQCKKRADIFNKVSKDYGDGFAGKLAEITAEWYKKCATNNSDSILSKWEDVGRDNYENGDALHRLGILAIQQNDFSLARDAITGAIKYMPYNPVLRRLQIKLFNGDSEIVKQAREACPSDSEIWLASIVDAVSNHKYSVVSNLISDAVADYKYTVSTVCRAGDLLYRNNMCDLAKRAADYGIKNGHGVLPPYVLASRCALKEKKWSQALDIIDNAIMYASDPAVFYETIVQIKKKLNQPDTEALNALEFLSKYNTTNRLEWTESLGFVYFKNKDMSRAYNVLAPIIKNNIKKVKADSLVIAAESARQQGEYRQASGIIEKAYELHPDDLAVLNNMVYYLASNPATLDSARKHVKTLLEKGGNSFEILDTVAMVYFYSGDLFQARKYINRALNLAPPGDSRVAEIQLNKARILFASGNLNEAKDIVSELRNRRDISFIVRNNVDNLLLQINRELQKKKKNTVL